MTPRALESQSPVIGVDFDNTLVTYDDLIYQVALERDLVGPDVGRTKRKIRDRIRELPDGEIAWQKIQALVYGPRMQEARPAPGAEQFFRNCASHGIRVHIVSHKTEFANYDETNTSLTGAALSWIKRHGFFDIPESNLDIDQVHFEPTRLDKLRRIKSLNCTHFIDDLEETFSEESFPSEVGKILYEPASSDAEGNRDSIKGEVTLAGNWQQITEYFFHDTD